MPDSRDISRRAFVIGATATVAASAAPTGAPGAPGTLGTAAEEMAGLHELSAVEAVQRMTRGEITAEGYAGALLTRCRSAQALNAFITLEPEHVLEDARARDKERLAGRKPGPRPRD